tara:strand:+ start:1670 stop:2584 length:915 start_codon:yes stop_codon:yes gene_type:complete
MFKYSCTYCQYYTNNKFNFKKHVVTQKHYNNIDEYDNGKKCNYYECANCNFITTSKKSMGIHIKENKHSSKTHYVINTEQANKRYQCEICNKSYKYVSGYYRHKNNCIGNNNLAKILKKTNEKLCERIHKLETSQNIITNNITNNKLDIHFYLNNECKDAMNLSEFVDKIKLSLDDLLYTKNNGYIKGITNIFIKNMQNLSLTERPFHSIQDKKTHQFYIKDKTGWECDKKEEQLDNSIDNVSKKQFRKIKEWEASRPDWNTTEEGIDEYMKMVQSIMGGIDEHERMRNKKKIKKDLKNNFILN